MVAARGEHQEQQVSKGEPGEESSSRIFFSSFSLLLPAAIFLSLLSFLFRAFSRFPWCVGWTVVINHATRLCVVAFQAHYFYGKSQQIQITTAVSFQTRFCSVIHFPVQRAEVHELVVSFTRARCEL
jgi:chromate transport protein ChrA